MTPIETATLVLSGIVLVIGAPVALFHHRIACELRHLRAHFFTHHHAARRHAPTCATGKRRDSRRKP